MTLCNLFSYICDQSDWEIITGNGWIWTTKPCQVETGTGIGDNMAIIPDKKWFNGDNNFVIEYMYTINNVVNIDSNAGIIVHFDTTCSHYYYIGISPNDSSVVFAEMFNDNLIVIDSTSLTDTYQSGKFYALKTEILNGDTFTISVNDNVLLSSVTSNLFGNSGLKEIGYIGIKTIASSIIAKSLFISGDIIFKTNPADITSWFSLCPTPSPTEIPTKSPSNIPSSTPTSNPTLSELSTTTPSVQCTDDKSAVVLISFKYVLSDNTTSSNRITGILTDITDQLINEKKATLTNCDIENNHKIIVNPNADHAMINITLCTTCDEVTITMDLKTDLLAINNNNIDIVTSDIVNHSTTIVIASRSRGTG